MITIPLSFNYLEANLEAKLEAITQLLLDILVDKSSKVHCFCADDRNTLLVYVGIPWDAVFKPLGVTLLVAKLKL